MNSSLIINSDRTITMTTDREIITFTYASFGARLLARLIDNFIIFIPSIFLPLFGPWLYWSLLQSGIKQSTIGQRAMNIKVISLENGKVTFGQATGLFFGRILSVIIFLIGYLLFFTSDKNQCLHDKLANCVVVKEIKRQPLLAEPIN